MVNKYIIVPTGELYHHGTKGMRWGIRRYQNKDGSLTPAGKKRYAKLEAEMEKLGGKKSDAKAAETETPKTKSVSEMTDQEINDRIDRIKLERSLIELMEKPITTVTSEKKTPEKKTSNAKSIVSEMFANSAKNIGQQTITYAMGAGVNLFAKKVLGIKNATEKRKRDDGTEEVVDIFQDIVNPRKGQKDK